MILGFFKRLVLFAVAVAAILFVMGLFNKFAPVMTFAWICYFVFIVLTFITYFFSAKTINGKLAGFMNIFFVSIFTKLIITAIIVLAYKSKNQTSDINFIIPFAIIYFSSLIFETIELVNLSKKIGNNNKLKSAEKKSN